MRHVTSWLLGAIVLGLATLVPVAAQAPVADPPRVVQDDVGFFSQKAKQQANEAIARLKRDYKKDLLIETVEKVKLPEGVNLDRSAQVCFNNSHVNGIYVVFVKDLMYKDSDHEGFS